MANANRHFVLSLYIFWYFLVSFTLAIRYCLTLHWPRVYNGAPLHWPKGIFYCPLHWPAGILVSLYIGQRVFHGVPLQWPKGIFFLVSLTLANKYSGFPLHWPTGIL
jgi:hypothetical protein